MHKFLNLLMIGAMLASVLIWLPAHPKGISAANFSADRPGVLELTGACRRVVDGFKTLEARQGYPAWDLHPKPARQPGDFDPNDYFQIFDHLKLTPGYLLDYVFFGDSVGGSPVLYARPWNSRPFDSYTALAQAYGGLSERQYSFLPLAYNRKYLEKVQPDQSPESYFQFLILALAGDQFYLTWHALYNDTQILCDVSDLETVTQETRNFFRNSEDDEGFPRLPPELLDQATRLDFRPLVQVGRSFVTIRFMSFSKWGGFIEQIYVLDKNNLAVPVDVHLNVMIPYDCGVMF